MLSLPRELQVQILSKAGDSPVLALLTINEYKEIIRLVLQNESYWRMRLDHPRYDPAIATPKAIVELEQRREQLDSFDWETMDIVIIFQRAKSYDGMRLYIHLYKPYPIYSDALTRREEFEDEREIMADSRTMEVIAPKLLDVGPELLYLNCNNIAINLCKHYKFNPVSLQSASRELYLALRDTGHLRSVDYDSLIFNSPSLYDDIFYTKEYLTTPYGEWSSLAFIFTSYIALAMLFPLLPFFFDCTMNGVIYTELTIVVIYLSGIFARKMVLARR
jgi:hypothetical protein